MKRSVLAICVLLLAATSAEAACYADYKAKRDAPLRLHYGVIEVPDRLCDDRARIEAYVQQQLERDDWTLLNVLGVFGDNGLDARKDNAGEFFLRY